MIITLQRKKEKVKVIIDKEDFIKVSQYSWHYTYKGYVAGFIDKKHTYLHRYIMDTPKGMVTDHINRNPLDNRKCNLRICSVRENVINAKLSENNKTGFRGVSYRKNRNKYRAYLMVNRKQVSLGHYHKYIDAVKARIKGEKKYFGIYAPST